MSSSVDYSLISNPALLDTVDEDWLRDTFPDDGAFSYRVALFRGDRGVLIDIAKTVMGGTLAPNNVLTLSLSSKRMAFTNNWYYKH